jgi:nucleoside-diphosphate-sugar epimerase
MTAQTIVITGASGGVAQLVRPRLAREGRTFRLVDVAEITPALDEVPISGSVTDTDVMRKACRGADAVIHLGGIATENTWETILDVNVNGTRTVLEAARLEGLRTVILASSNHAVGFRTRDEGVIASDVAPRPDTYYGVSKAAMEALGTLYHDRCGMNVICLRIGSCFERPPSARALATWLSPDDCARLMEAALTATGYHLVWGISANARRWWSLAEGEAIGYHPVDDAEVFAAEFEEVDPHAPDQFRVGGPYCRLPLGEPNT